jgi:hypothetical protein
MKTNSKNIELFQNLSLIEFDNSSFDLHNDFNCLKVKLQNNVLILVFQNIVHKFLVIVSFNNITFTVIEFNFTEIMRDLTIDNLYRGRFEVNETLIEFDNGRGYFYLEFCEGQKFEFWSEGMSIERQ